MRITCRPVLVGLGLALSCGGGSTAVPPSPLPQQPPEPAAAIPEVPPAPKFRLDGKVVPRSYAVDLDIVPTADTFDGTVDIDVELREAASGLWLSGAELTVKEATLSVAGAPPFALTPLPPPPGDDPLFIGFAFGRLVPAGPARLRIQFSGKLQQNETLGAFKQKDRDEWYVFTQFETADASRAFPCFDEPQWKTPWDITLRVRPGDAAFAMTPIASEAAAEGKKVVKFTTSKPLPSYLVAFAVGPFATVDARPTKSGTPIRIITPKGRADEAAYAKGITPRMTEILDDYFGIPYPFEKLDSIAVPHTIAFLAMENPGLITYNHECLLSRPADETLAWRQKYASVGAHEIAHMWFGDLVTLAWWDDTWLNESFASWAGSKTVEVLEPGWGEEVERVAQRNRILGQDSSASARPIRQEVETLDDMVTAFDYTAYGKGQAVLEMFEAWLGPELFRKGVNAYLARYAYGTATAKDFFAAIGEAAGRDVSPVLTSFVDQPGVPLVTAKLNCAAGAAPRLELAQERYHPAGIAAPEQTWNIPVCARFAAGGKDGRVCTVLEAAQAELELPAASCPDWVYPNAGGSGYYRAALGGDLAARLDKVLATQLTRAERVAYLGDVGALLRNGAVPAADALALVRRIDPASDWRLAEAANLILRPVRSALVTPEQRPAYGRLIARLYGTRARALGLRVKPGEGNDILNLRDQILVPAAIDGRDARLAAEGRALAVRWLEERKAVHPELVDDVLAIAAATADRPLFNRLLGAVKTLPDAADRSRIIRAFVAIRDPAYMREVMGLFLDKDVDVREMVGLFYGIAGSMEETILGAADAYAREHFDALAARLPRPAQALLMAPGAGFCDEKRLAEFQAGWNERAGKMLNGKRVFEKNLATIRTCISLRQTQQKSAARFFAGM